MDIHTPENEFEDVFGFIFYLLDIYHLRLSFSSEFPISIPTSIKIKDRHIHRHGILHPSFANYKYSDQMPKLCALLKIIKLK